MTLDDYLSKLISVQQKAHVTHAVAMENALEILAVVRHEIPKLVAVAKAAKEVVEYEGYHDDSIDGQALLSALALALSTLERK